VDVNRDALVLASSETEIAATPETVWNVLTDLGRWPDWNPDVKSIALSGEVAEGTQFRWKAGPGTITSTIRAVERPRLIGWTGKTLGIDAAHVYRLEPHDGSTHVSTEESYEGLVASAFRGPLRRVLETSLQNGLERLKAEAEHRTKREGP
jgi:uncharacterized protein YndB with AHSA1/START domain